MTTLPCRIARVSPSLALIKYWGKADSVRNLPATPSLAVTLDGLRTETRAWCVPKGRQRGMGDCMVVGGAAQPPERHAAFFDALRADAGLPDAVFWAESANNFPTAAGLASSSSGFAALSVATAAAAGLTGFPASGSRELPEALAARLSAVARIGSGSAARALFGGFTLLPASSETAVPLVSAGHWPDLRVVIVRVSEAAKPVSSREAMERSRRTSPYYPAWVADAPGVCAQAVERLEARDLDGLGRLMLMSYQRMFATMFSSDPPVIYWKPESLALIKLCAELRAGGLPVWETMDAGPQVKLFCTKDSVDALLVAVAKTVPGAECVVDRPGDGPGLLAWSSLLGPVSPVLAERATAAGFSLADTAGETPVL